MKSLARLERSMEGGRDKEKDEEMIRMAWKEGKCKK